MQLLNRIPLSYAASTVIFAALLFIALIPLVPRGTGVEEGEVATRTIRAPRALSFISEELTKRRQDEAAAAVPDVLAFDPSIAATQQTQLSNQLSRLRAIVEDPNPDSRVSALARIDDISLSPA